MFTKHVSMIRCTYIIMNIFSPNKNPTLFPPYPITLLTKPLKNEFSCPFSGSRETYRGRHIFMYIYIIYIHLFIENFNPLMAIGIYSYQFLICCPRDCVSRHNGGTSVPPLNPSESIVLSEHYRLWGD